MSTCHAYKTSLQGDMSSGTFMHSDCTVPTCRLFSFQLNVLIDTGSSNLAIACKEDETIDKYFMPEK